MPTARQMEQAQVAYSRRLAASQNAALAQKESTATRTGRTYSQTHPAPTALPDYSPFFWTFVLLFLLPAIVAAAILYAVKERQKRPAQPQTGHYAAAASLLTPTEAKFHAVLTQAVGPMAVIQCKVRIADILTTRRGDYASFNRICRKHCDFVLCDRASLRPLMCVELDDPSHDRRDRQERDRFVDSAYAQAGMPILHIRTAERYDAAQLLAQVQPHLLTDVWGRV